MISIIIPFYKVEKFIVRCAQSLFSQSYKDIEFIFVDDCSPDRSMEQLHKVISDYPYLKPRIKILHHKINRGISASRETGLAAANGDYVYWVDADDWIEPDTIEKMVQLTEEGKIDIVGCGWALCFDKREKKMQIPYFPDTVSAFRGMLCGQLRWNLWLFLIKRSLYVENNIHFVEGRDVGEDMFVLISIFFHAKSISFVNEHLYHYVKQNNESITKSNPIQLMERLKPNLNATIDFLSTHLTLKFEREMCYFKLNVKLPLLISDNNNAYEIWNSYFPEVHKYIWSNKKQSLRMRFLQIMAVNQQYWFLRFYYRFIYRFIYGIYYK